MRAENYEAACDGFRALVLRSEAPAWGVREYEIQVAQDFERALRCMEESGRIAEMDAFRDEAVAKHSENWRMPWVAAESLAGGTHAGYLLDGKFTRGKPPQAEGTVEADIKVVDALERDRARAMQWMHDAMPLARRDSDRATVARYFLSFGRIILLGRMETRESEFVSASGAWKLQFLTSLGALPGYQTPDAVASEVDPGAPVGRDGKPLLYAIPHGFLAATNDGQRWRYCLKEAREFDRSLRDEVFFQTAGFFHAQYGVQTLAFYGPAFGRLLDARTKGEEGGVLDLDTLPEEETVARLATGVERFRMPEAFNFIRLYRNIVRQSQPYYAGKALIRLAEIFENRRQYAKAAEYWRTLIARRDGDVRPWEARLAQIIGPWGRFEPVMPQPAGKAAELPYRFRNGHSLRCEAYSIDVQALLADVEAYLKSRPKKLDFERTDIADIGHRLLSDENSKYLSGRVAAWSAEIQPRSGHFDRTVTLKTPLSRPGAYLVKSAIVGGNTSAIVAWISDTAIVRRPMAESQFFFVADSVTGRPIPNASVRFFGWRQTHAENHEYIVETEEFSAGTDEEGRLTVPNETLAPSFRWLVSATTEEGRFALLGWESFGMPGEKDREYDVVKAFLMTDRPEYRPGENVRYKFWVRRASYRREDDAESEFAGKTFEVGVFDPAGTEIAKSELIADSFGGIAGEITLPTNAVGGSYRAVVRFGPELEPLGEGSFLVGGGENLDFTVSIDTPEPLFRLGDPNRFTISATYLGGAPLTRGMVRYSVYRRPRGPLYPPREWDWLYGPGYWWLEQPAWWLPGWTSWGRAVPPSAEGKWESSLDASPPELVAMSDAELSEDGTLGIALPTALARALYPDENQEYVIEARVTDQMRRTVAARAEVLAARRPVEAVVWIDRGFAESGEAIRAFVYTSRADGVPVARAGRLIHYRIEHDPAGNPTEELLNEWELSTDALGYASRLIESVAAGQYRLVFVFDESVKPGGPPQRVEGGCSFTVTGGTEASEYRFAPVWITPERASYRPGEKIKLLVATNRPGAHVLLFERPEGGVYKPPRVVPMNAKTAYVELEATAEDVPNLFVEAVAVFDGVPHASVRQIVIPPDDRVMEVALEPSSGEYLPGEDATLRVSLTGEDGDPVEGTAVIAIFEKALREARAKGRDIRSFFWKWTRRHTTRGASNLEWVFHNLVPDDSVKMENLGIFGDSVPGGALADAVEAASGLAVEGAAFAGGRDSSIGGPGGPARTETGFWFAEVRTDAKGAATVEVTLPDSSTRWEIAGWGLADGTRVGQAERTIVTRKDFQLSLESPAYLVRRDRATFAAVMRNYTSEPTRPSLKLNIVGNAIATRGQDASRTAVVKPDDPSRVSWTIDATEQGEASLSVEANVEGVSDSMEKRLRVFDDRIPTIESKAGLLGPGESSTSVMFTLPEDVHAGGTVLTVRVAASLGAAVADAIPFLFDSPRGGTGRAVERFLPALMLQRALKVRGADIRSPEESEAAAELPNQDAQSPVRLPGSLDEEPNPVFDAGVVAEAAEKEIAALVGMQLDDGGWGWFYGWGEESNAFDTATAVAGLARAADFGIEVDAECMSRGFEWLKRHEEEQIRQIRNYGYTPYRQPYKPGVEDTDAFVFLVLSRREEPSDEMAEFLSRDVARPPEDRRLTPLGITLYCEALLRRRDGARLSPAIRTLWSCLRTDEAKEQVWVVTPAEDDSRRNGWSGNHMACQAAFLRLLARLDPDNELLPKVVRYIMNRRTNGTHWDSPFDTAWCVESLAEYLYRREGAEPASVSVDVSVKDRVTSVVRNSVTISAEHRFRTAEPVFLRGRKFRPGEISLQVTKRGTGPVYFGAVLKTNPAENSIAPSGKTVTIERTYYRLEPIGDATTARRFARYRRRPFSEVANLVPGDLIEVELNVRSEARLDKMIIADHRPAGFEPVGLREGYSGNALGAFVENLEDRTVFFTPRLTEGSRYTVSYRMQARTEGSFTAMPATVSGPFAPGIRANTSEIRVQVVE